MIKGKVCAGRKEVMNMNGNKANILRLISRWACAAMSVISGALCVISCVKINAMGDRPFTPEAITQSFDKISFFLYLTLAFIVASCLLNTIIRGEKVKVKPIRDQKEALKRLASRKQSDETIAKERNQRIFIDLATASFILIAYLYPIIYVFSPANFGVKDITGDVTKSVIYVLISTVLVIAALYVRSYYIEKSILRAIAHYKLLPDMDEISAQNGMNQTAILAVILVIALVLIFAGIFNEGIADVLGKAIRICTECIGLG